MGDDKDLARRREAEAELRRWLDTYRWKAMCGQCGVVSEVPYGRFACSQCGWEMPEAYPYKGCKFIPAEDREFYENLSLKESADANADADEDAASRTLVEVITPGSAVLVGRDRDIPGEVSAVILATEKIVVRYEVVWWYGRGKNVGTFDSWEAEIDPKGRRLGAARIGFN